MSVFRKIVGAAAVTGLLVLGAACWSSVHKSLQWSRTKRTMAGMYFFVKAIEERRPHAVPRDAWGHPMRVEIRGAHYSIRAACADGSFERTVPQEPRVATEGFDADILLVDGRFVQFPNGICAGDQPGKGPLGDCASCHPGRTQKR